MIAALSLAGSSPARAWNWDSAYAPGGDQLTWHLCEGNFTSAEETEITKGAAGWDAGAGRNMRGALWNFARGADRAHGDCGPDNGVDEVYVRSQAWFDSMSIGSSAAYCLCDNGDGLNDRDLVFKSTVDWQTVVPSQLATGKSIGQTALHEFGHLLGFLHEDTVLATMSTTGLAGGDISAFKYRAQEDDYVGLTVKHPDSSAGTNLMLGKFTLAYGEVWDDPNYTYGSWAECDTDVYADDGPEPIYAIIHSTSCKNPVIKWWLSVDSTCNWGSPDILVGTVTANNLCSGTPTLYQPNPYHFGGVPADDYYLCASINADGTINETTVLDNTLRSEVNITISDCP